MVKRVLTLCVFLALFTACRKDEPYRRQNFLLGTTVSVTFYGDMVKAKAASDEIFTFIQELHNCVNIYDDTSELSRLNSLAFQQSVNCSDLLWDILMAARRGYDISEGYFDVTSGPLMKLWGFHRKRESLPTDEELNLTLKRVGLENVLFDEENRSIRFAREGMVIDFGGIAKGYALDRCKSIVEKYSIKSGIIDLGGNVYCLKVPPENRSFYNVGIRKPRGYGLDDVVKIKDQFVATSGDYERFVIIDGKRITHIVNPKTGKPVENVASVSVVTAEGVDSDIFSTAIFVGGEEISKKLVKNSPSTQYMIVKAEGKERFSFVTYGNVWSKNRKEDEE